VNFETCKNHLVKQIGTERALFGFLDTVLAGSQPSAATRSRRFVASGLAFIGSVETTVDTVGICMLRVELQRPARWGEWRRLVPTCGERAQRTNRATRRSAGQLGPPATTAFAMSHGNAISVYGSTSLAERVHVGGLVRARAADRTAPAPCRSACLRGRTCRSTPTA